MKRVLLYVLLCLCVFMLYVLLCLLFVVKLLVCITSGLLCCFLVYVVICVVVVCVVVFICCFSYLL